MEHNALARPGHNKPTKQRQNPGGRYGTNPPRFTAPFSPSAANCQAFAAGGRLKRGAVFRARTGLVVDWVRRVLGGVGAAVLVPHRGAAAAAVRLDRVAEGWTVILDPRSGFCGRRQCQDSYSWAGTR